MPEYLAPGVFVEEVSFRSKSIEGVPTSTTGFAGLARYGPVCYPEGPKTCEPRLITSFVEFERVYGGLEHLWVGAADPGDERLLYVARVFVPRDPESEDPDWGLARFGFATAAGTPVTWRARWPGRAGNVKVESQVVRSKNLAIVDGAGAKVPRARAGMVFEVFSGGATPAKGNEALVVANLRVARNGAGGAIEFVDSTGATPALAATDVVQLVELTVVVTVDADRTERSTELAASPLQKRYVHRILEKDDPEDEDSVVWLEFDADAEATALGAAADFAPARLAVALQGNPGTLAGGHDGLLLGPDDVAGHETDLDDPTRKATGLAALGEIDDIAIVAAPDGGTLGDVDQSAGVADR